jgi:hypothetical protein
LQIFTLAVSVNNPLHENLAKDLHFFKRFLPKANIDAIFTGRSANFKQVINKIPDKDLIS